ncbi:hypothetical protein D8674_008244 [Pyrus ussuriensis x Pyrus communis]|uniref:Uncharacterized protein n=1 Tax=Pyrus ussuriensis x Pyrus communis TaxID=2448454 RepID=A0A5N5HS87_9ROSA|nr:hypothetical protein D8674_008244 [Pyrus ussuriensis x Pyrus communis]
MHMIDELNNNYANWDIDKSDSNLMKAIDNVFKLRFQEWKFDNECTPISRIGFLILILLLI